MKHSYKIFVNGNFQTNRSRGVWFPPCRFLMQLHQLHRAQSEWCKCKTFWFQHSHEPTNSLFCPPFPPSVAVYENEDRLLWDPYKLLAAETERFLTQVHPPPVAGMQSLKALPTGCHIRDDERVRYSEIYREVLWSSGKVSGLLTPRYMVQISQHQCPTFATLHPDVMKLVASISGRQNWRLSATLA